MGGMGVCLSKQAGLQLGNGSDTDLHAFRGSMRVQCKALWEYTESAPGYTTPERLDKSTLCEPGVLDGDDEFWATAMEIFHCV